MPRVIAALVLAATVGLTSQDPLTGDPEVRAVVERFFAAQQAEDVEAYLALWSSRAQRPRAEQLRFIFDSGDDRFSELAIQQVTRVGDLVRVRVSVLRERTMNRFGGTPRTTTSRPTWNMTLARDGGELRILSEGQPADDLAAALVAAATAAERDELLAAEPDLLNERLVLALTRRADNLAISQKFADALPIYGIVLEVAQRMGDTKAEAEVLQSIGNAYYFQRRFPEALRAYERRLAIERTSANEGGAANALLGIATIRYSLYEYAEALVAYREALALYERLGEEAGMASALVSTGNVQYIQGDYERAITDYRRSRSLYRKLLDTDGEARASDGLGRAHTAQGDYAAALEAFAVVREEGRARANRSMLAGALQSIGDVHFRLGNAETARAGFDESRQLYEALGDQASAGRAWQRIAVSDLLGGRFAPAEKAYASSEAACRSARDPGCVAHAIVGLALAQQLQERFDPAVESYRTAIAAFTALKEVDDARRAEVGLSQALFGRKDYAPARAAAVRARDGVSLPDIVWRAHVAEGRALRKLEDPRGALGSAGEAVAIVERLRAESLERPSLRVPADTASAYTLLAVLQAEAGNATAAFETLERRQAHALRTALANNERDIARGMDGAARAEERDAAIRVMSIQAQIDRERELPKPDRTRIGKLEGQLADATRARALQQQRLFERWPDLRLWRGLAPAAAAADLDAVLTTDGDALVSFAIDDHDLLAVVATRIDGTVTIQAHLAPTGRLQLAERVAEAVTPAALGDGAEWRKAAGALLDALPRAAIDAMSAARQVIVVPDDMLWRVPFEALPVANGYLGDDVVFGYAGSLTALVRPPAGDASGRALSLVALGAPVVSTELAARLRATMPGWTLRESEATERELAAAARGYGDSTVTIVSGSRVTESLVRHVAPLTGLLHVGLPFRLNSASPLFSPLVTSRPWSPVEGNARAAAPAPDAGNDGVIEARDILNMDLRATLAVLADGGALSMREAAAAAPTMQWAWRAAGVPTLAIARWTTEAGSSERLVSEFYARLRAGDAPAAALQAARRRVRTGGGTSAPAHWAGWLIIGGPVRAGGPGRSPSP
jgi:tetratricopeptide (TPR) repeat protein